VANWRLIEGVGQTLVALIDRKIAQLGVANVTCDVVTGAAFTTLASTAAPFISLFLYQINNNAELRNLMETVRPDGSRGRQPLPLELCYLVTAWGVRNPADVASDSLAAREEARLLGVVLQALYENAEVGRGDLVESGAAPVWAVNDSLQVVLQSLPVETHYRIWDAGELGYRLSLSYRVRVTSLEPDAVRATPPVVEAGLEMA
jgi:hypothetical protein